MGVISDIFILDKAIRTQIILEFRQYFLFRNSSAPPHPNPLPPGEGGLDNTFLFGEEALLCSLPLDGGGSGWG